MENYNKEVGKRITQAREHAEMTRKELADKAHVSPSTITRYENGEFGRVKLALIESFAKATGVNPAWIDGNSDKMFLTDAERFGKTAEIFNETHPNLLAVRIPVVRRVAAGIPLDSIEEIIGWEEMPSYKVKDDKYFGLKIQGNSMEPGIADGDIVLVREQPDAEDGQIVVALINGNDGVCKRLKKYENGMIALMSDNPAYKPMYFNCSEVENTPIVIRGVVKELRRAF